MARSDALTAPRGPSSIETAAEEVTAAAEVLELVRGHRDVDAYLIACFSDPAVEAARELTEAPVVGIGEAAYRAVLMLARRFAVITTLPRGVPEIENGMGSLGVRDECVGVLSLGIPVAEQGAEFGDTNDAIVAADSTPSRTSGPRRWYWRAAAWRRPRRSCASASAYLRRTGLPSAPCSRTRSGGRACGRARSGSLVPPAPVGAPPVAPLGTPG